jgi:Na+-transporting NADH:ubiquinone oxidoreductase subunit NqrB
LIVRLRAFAFLFTASALARGISSALAGSALRHRLIAGLAFTLMFAAALSGSTLTR